MLKKSDYKAYRNSLYNLNYKLVVLIKNKEKVINENIEIELRNIIYSIFLKFDCPLKSITVIDKCYVEICFEGNLKLSIPKLVNSFKTVSSRKIRKKYMPCLLEVNLNNNFWESNYFISTKG